MLLTGTGIVPAAPFTLLPGDVVRIEIDGLGILENPVASVGSPGPATDLSRRQREPADLCDGCSRNRSAPQRQSPRIPR